MFKRGSIQDEIIDGVIQVTYDYKDKNQLMFGLIDITIFERSSLISYTMTKDEAKKLIKILQTAIGEEE